MKLLYFHQYYITPRQAGGTRSYYLARQLCNKADEVVVITGNTNKPDWPFIRSEVEGNLKVVHIRNIYNSQMGVARRILAFLQFMLAATYVGLRERKVDKVYASSTPLSIGVPALVLFYLRRIPFVFELRDLWPDVPRDMGYIKSDLVFRLLKWFEKILYRKAESIIAISQGIKDLIGPEYADKTFVYPFGSNLSLFAPTKDDSWKVEQKIEADLLVIYTGAIGVANGVEYLVDAARLLDERGEKNVHIAIVGDGSSRESVAQALDTLQLANCSLHPPVPLEELPRIYSASDVGVVLFAGLSASHRYTASPNKLFDYVSAGLPVVFNFSGPLKQQIESERFGVFTDPGNAEELADAIQKLAQDREMRCLMSTAARDHAEQFWDRDRILEELAQRLVEPGSVDPCQVVSNRSVSADIHD